ncbi:MAG: PAS domain S-box protein [Desulfobulbaceae bacterium]|nr:PAS domain S-box protein [Desulfobulbaceae bacterium]
MWHENTLAVMMTGDYRSIILPLLPQNIPLVKPQTNISQAASSDGVDQERPDCAEERLQRLSRLNEQIVNSVGEGIIVYGPDLRYLAWNPTMERISGKKASDVLGRHPLEVFPHLQDVGVIDRLERTLRGEVCPPLEFHALTVSGIDAWSSDSCSPLYNDKGEIIGVIGIVRDITANRKGEEALRKSREKFRTLYDQTPIMLHSIDRFGDLIDVNSYWLKTMGYERSEVLGHKVIDFYSESSRQYALEIIQPAFFRDGFCKNVPYQFVKKNGELLDVLLSASSEQDAEGNVVRSRAVIENITERKRSEEHLRQREQLIRSILDNVDEGFVLLDREYRVLSANRSYCRQNKAGDQDVIGRYCYEVARQYSRPCYEYGEGCVIRHVFETGKPFQSVHTQEDSQGETRHVETRGFPLFDAAGQLTSAIKVIHDVTDHYRLEAEQIKTEKLEAIGALAGGIAHDFNNLLQGVFGYLSMARLAIDNKDEALAALEQAEKALGLSIKLTMQLLTFSKGGKPVKNRADIRQVIENSAKFALSGSKCGWHLRMAEDLWQAEVDEGQIGQVIQNIVLNGVQAMDEGGRIEISADNFQAPGRDLPPELAAGEYIRIMISDNGPGIPSHLLGKIFDPYFTTKAEGSGLGLATSYSIISKHDGLIDVHSETGRGTTFFVYLPAMRGEGRGALSATAACVDEAVTQKSGKILVMDDDQVIRDLAVLMIKALGHEVESAEHGEEAIRRYRLAMEAGKPFDVVVLDLTIRGGMGGFDTVRHLQEIDPKVKAVVSSGYSDGNTLAEYKQLGFAACLHKPYSLAELKGALKTLV